MIRADGRIGLTGAGKVEQIRLLCLEGVEVSDTGKINIKRADF
ncbi:hypothetical protein RT41_GL001230 [Lactococcus fujiensis JCM 16395]|uniref:Uncharacterized protein n=1 Tax=Lactococcus fujiensis JCM 16395 TaxID=1291764 RepID=A0A2A5RM29_9LACT|nr:hypothetical protein RT41_GL001230 [Lactococcus fujiensis JCM 16395]